MHFQLTANLCSPTITADDTAMCSLSRRGSTSLAGCQPLEGATDLPRQALTAGHDVTLIRLLKFGVGRVSKGQHVTASVAYMKQRKTKA